jgi:hypothetical protein
VEPQKCGMLNLLSDAISNTIYKVKENSFTFLVLVICLCSIMDTVRRTHRITLELYHANALKVDLAS